jgi:sulfide:quinone oxidoreductase
VQRVVFAMPAAQTPLLPLYELALLTAAHLSDRGKSNVDISVVTPEQEPLSVFGIQASEALRELLGIRGIEVRTGTTPVALKDGVLRVVPDETIQADAVVSLPRMEGVRIEGLEYDAAGFVRTNEFGHVGGLDNVYAAGDIIAFPIKQGGIAAQQADAAADSIAACCGAAILPTPFRPVLRGLLLTGMFPRFLYGEPGKAVSMASTEALWWPPAKIAGRYLGPFLARRFGIDGSPGSLAGGGVFVEQEIDLYQHA